MAKMGRPKMRDEDKRQFAGYSIQAKCKEWVRKQGELRNISASKIVEDLILKQMMK